MAAEVVEKSAAPTNWANLFTTNKFAAKGMELEYVAPMIVEGEVVAQLQQEDIQAGIEAWKHALIFYVVGTSPTIAVVERYIVGTCNFVAAPKVYYHNDDFFLIKFQSIADRDEVLF